MIVVTGHPPLVGYVACGLGGLQEPCLSLGGQSDVCVF